MPWVLGVCNPGTDSDSRGDDWVSHGRTPSEQRYSPLTDINTSNVKSLGLAWQLELGTDRGLEATPLMVEDRKSVV